jgi:hypothetical protein
LRHIQAFGIFPGMCRGKGRGGENQGGNARR